MTELHHRVIGSGPPLLMISPGAGRASALRTIAEQLAGTFTVVTYDRDSTRERPSIAAHADDAGRLLEPFAPAYVFGSSIGALIGLELAVRHAGSVRALVAHEPPLLHLLPADERPRLDLHQAFRADGAESALRAFAARLGVDRGQQSSPEAAEYFLGTEVGSGMLARYRADLDTLAGTRVIPGGGAEGRDFFPFRCAAELARRLGTPLAEFPGNHTGFVTHPAAFTARLAHVLIEETGGGHRHEPCGND
ncbi:alpha/beta fold hydrolase [Nonomuraea sp. CA-141351]|uniref:alpha/beta fold hydrolase n=1 Tax=Nonomuraea sp. CA-141351 TaxID=3239996 RepID=UPI003D8EEFF4